MIACNSFDCIYKHVPVVTFTIKSFPNRKPTKTKLNNLKKYTFVLYFEQCDNMLTLKPYRWIQLNKSLTKTSQYNRINYRRGNKGDQSKYAHNYFQYWIICWWKLRVIRWIEINYVVWNNSHNQKHHANERKISRSHCRIETSVEHHLNQFDRNLFMQNIKKTIIDNYYLFVNSVEHFHNVNYFISIEHIHYDNYYVLIVTEGG